jgi:hypothetical protein
MLIFVFDFSMSRKCFYCACDRIHPQRMTPSFSLRKGGVYPNPSWEFYLFFGIGRSMETCFRYSSYAVP